MEIGEEVVLRDFVKVIVVCEDGLSFIFEVFVCFDFEVEIDYYCYGGILLMVFCGKLK